jgi:hypothetical protein
LPSVFPAERSLDVCCTHVPGLTARSGALQRSLWRQVVFAVALSLFGSQIIEAEANQRHCCHLILVPLRQKCVGSGDQEQVRRELIRLVEKQIETADEERRTKLEEIRRQLTALNPSPQRTNPRVSTGR